MAETAAKTEDIDIFDALSSGIDESERKDMLRRMGENNAPDGDGAPLFSRKMTYKEKNRLMEKYDRLSIFTRILMWIRSFLTGSSMEDVMNEYDVRRIAREVEAQRPSLLMYRKKLLCEGFYTELSHLRSAADFFRPYMERFDKNPASVYMFIGDLLVPEIGEKIMQDMDSALLSVDNELLPDTQKKMLESMVNTLATIPNDKRQEMANFVRSVVWIDQLTKLSLRDFQTLFGKPGDSGHECLFSLVRKDVSRLAAVICGAVPLEDRVVEVFKYLNGDGTLKEQADFAVEALEHIPTVRHFANFVPMDKIAKIVNGDALYTVTPLKQDENWFDVYTQEWKHRFDKKVQHWQMEQKRKQLQGLLKRFFRLQEFPMLPSRPWLQIWGGLYFCYEYSMGLINNFMERYFHQYIKILKMLLLEGEFAMRDNRQELNTAVDELVRVNEQLQVLRTQLSVTGEYSVGILRFKDKEKGSSQVAATQVDKIMSFITRDSREIEKLMDSSCCRLQSLLNGFLSDKIIGRYCTISNLHQLHNDEYNVESILKECHSRFLHLYEILKDLELLEKEDAKERGIKL